MIIFYTKNIPNLTQEYIALCVKLNLDKSSIFEKLYYLNKQYVAFCNDVEIKPSDYGWRS